MSFQECSSKSSAASHPPLRIGMQAQVRTARLGDDTNDAPAANMTFLDFTGSRRIHAAFLVKLEVTKHQVCGYDALSSAFLHLPVALRANRIHHILIQDKLDVWTLKSRCCNPAALCPETASLFFRHAKATSGIHFLFLNRFMVFRYDGGPM